MTEDTYDPETNPEKKYDMQTYFELGSFLKGIMSPVEFFLKAYTIKSVLSEHVQMVFKVLACLHIVQRISQLQCDFIEACRNFNLDFLHKKRQIKIVQNHKRSFKKYCFDF